VTGTEDEWAHEPGVWGRIDGAAQAWPMWATQVLSYERRSAGSTCVMAGDAEIEELVRGLEPRLARAFAAAYGRGRAEEALAEALAYAWEHRLEVLAMGNPGGYLYRVGQSRSRPRRQPPLFPPAEDLGLPEVEPVLATAFAELSVRQRECVALVVANEWSLQEAADLLGISKSAVQTHLERGMAHLRKRLGALT
jgi:DNA-directed RNA polymerase specialized sigma24 family protein